MSAETMNDKPSKKEDFFDKVIRIDKKTATKYIIKGFVFVIIFGSAIYTSMMVNTYAPTYYNLESQRLKNAFYDGVIGEREYKEEINDLLETQYLMQYQYAIVGSIARLCSAIAMLFIVIGFLGYANNKDMDDKTRVAALVLAVVFLFMTISATFSGFRITIGV